MLKINKQVNMNYEVNAFAYRYYNDVAFYNDKLKGTKLAESLDACYRDAVSVFREVETRNPEIVQLMRLYHELRNVLITFPFLDLMLKHVSVEDAKAHIIRITKESFENIDAKSYENLSMFDLVSQADMDVSIKWQLIAMYENAEVLYEQYQDLIRRLTPPVERIITTHQADIDTFIEAWTALNQTGDLQVSEYFGITLTDDDYEMFPSLIAINQGTFYQEFVFLGLSLTPEYKSSKPMTLVHALEIAKAISDPTKSSILALLREKTMYGKELATALNLSGATVSYHIQELLQNACITMEQVEKTNRSYYSVHYKTIQDALSILQDTYQ